MYKNTEIEYETIYDQKREKRDENDTQTQMCTSVLALVDLEQAWFDYDHKINRAYM